MQIREITAAIATRFYEVHWGLHQLRAEAQRCQRAAVYLEDEGHLDDGPTPSLDAFDVRELDRLHSALRVIEDACTHLLTYVPTGTLPPTLLEHLGRAVQQAEILADNYHFDKVDIDRRI